MQTLTSQQIAKRFQLARPINGITTQKFGQNLIDIYVNQYGLKGHPGLDIGASTGTREYAPCDGTISYVGEDARGSAYGIHVYIKTAEIPFVEGSFQGVFYLDIVMGHMEHLEKEWKIGDLVKKGDLIGYCGCTGACTGPHCHLGIKPYYKQTIKGLDTWVADIGNGYGGCIDPEPLLDSYPLDLEKIYQTLDGRLVKSTDSPMVFLLKDKEKRWFPNEEILWSHGYKLWGVGQEEIVKLAPFEINAIPTGVRMPIGQYWDYLQGILMELKNYVRQK